MRDKHILVFFVVCAVFSLFLQATFAGVSAEEAAKLKTTLTPMGAEKAGNADGSIPAWTGGYTTVPPNYKPGDPHPDPFAGEKPLYTITGKNMDKYADKLCDGQKFLLKKFADYRMDVYPTHRTFAAPQFVYDNTFKNATRAKTTNNGLSIEGAYSGAPFPIPKDGYEVMWNHLTSWRGVAYETHFKCWIVHPDGTLVLSSGGPMFLQYPYYMAETKSYEDWKKDGAFYFLLINFLAEPPFKAGEGLLIRDPVDMYTQGRQAYQYLSGQRRVRRAPAIAYDTPDYIASGQQYFDELYCFAGALDRYQWKLLGKKEMIVSYNSNTFYMKPVKDVLIKGHENPDYMRWELHRVWVVEGTLAPGKRHVIPKRMMYLDEDCWQCLRTDEWDAQGALWKTICPITMNMPDFPTAGMIGQINMDLQSGSYVVPGFPNECRVQIKKIPQLPDSFFSPEQLAAKGVR
jgi:hypothetical protein